MFFVYILQSEHDQSYYKGFTEDLLLRLKRHNNGDSGINVKTCGVKKIIALQLNKKEDQYDFFAPANYFGQSLYCSILS